MICHIVYKLHQSLFSQLLDWCSPDQRMVLTTWLCSVILLYVIIAYVLKMVKTCNFQRENDPLKRICKSIEENDIVECIRLLEEYPQYINRFTNDGYTPFHIACANGNTQLVKIMIRKGADVRLKSIKKESPFYLATFFYIKCPQYSNATCIRELYYAGADINEANDKGLTPLQMAAMFGHSSLVKWLLLKNASTNTVPDPYFIACNQGHQDTARLIWTFTMGFSLKYK